MAWDQLEPIDVNDRRDISSAIIASTIANCNSVKTTYKLADFLPDWTKRTDEPEPWQKTKAYFMMLARGNG